MKETSQSHFHMVPSDQRSEASIKYKNFKVPSDQRSEAALMFIIL